jgi:hypothetical protein
MWRKTHKIQGLLAAVYVRKNFSKFVPFQALCMLESTHDILLERLFELTLLRVGPPPTVFKEELIPCDGIIDALTIFNFLPCTVGK